MAQTWHYRCSLCTFTTIDDRGIESGVLAVRKHSLQAHGETSIMIRSYERTEGEKNDNSINNS